MKSFYNNWIVGAGSIKHGTKLHYLERQYGAYLKFIRMGTRVVLKYHMP